MERKDKEQTRHDTLSCGALPWRRRNGTVQVLLIKQFANKERWGIPKGHVDPGERHEACAVREVREETGLSVRLDRRLPRLHDSSVTTRDGKKTVYAWFAQVDGADEPTNHDPRCEVADARWFDVGALPEFVAYQRATIEAAARLLASLPADV